VRIGVVRMRMQMNKGGSREEARPPVYLRGGAEGGGAWGPPCRRTSASNAASSRRSTKSVSSCPSVRPAPSATSAARRRCWTTRCMGLVIVALPPWMGRGGSSTYYSSVEAIFIQFFSQVSLAAVHRETKAAAEAYQQAEAYCNDSQSGLLPE
jgi:hypothetical protein